jgi:hypothetical protein
MSAILYLRERGTQIFMIVMIYFDLKIDSTQMTRIRRIYTDFFHVLKTAENRCEN